MMHWNELTARTADKLIVSCKDLEGWRWKVLLYLSAEPSLSHNLVTVVRAVDRAPGLPFHQLFKLLCHQHPEPPILCQPA